MQIVYYPSMSLSRDDDGYLLQEVFTAKGGSKPVLDSMNYFYRHKLPEIISSFRITTPDGRVGIFDNVNLIRPKVTDLKSKGVPRDLYPYEARMNKLNYMGSIVCNLSLYRQAEGGLIKIDDQETEVFIGKIPAMIGSELCHTYDMTPEEREKHGEPKRDPQAYFIINGMEKVLLNIEKLRTLAPYIYESDNGYVIRNTSETLMDTSVVIVQENRIDVKTKYRYDIQVTFTKIGIGANSINVFFIFYILGFTKNTVDSVYSMIESYIVDPDPERQARRRKMARNYLISTENTFLIALSKGSDVIYNTLYKVLRIATYQNDPELFKKVREVLIAELFRNITTATLTPEQAVIAKARLLASMIAKYVDFRNGFRKSDDRDSWSCKRIVDATNHMSNKFVQLFRTMMTNLQNKVNTSKLSTVDQIKKSLEQVYMGEQFITVFKKGIWGKTKDGKDIVVVDTLKRDNLLASWAHIRRITSLANSQGQIRDKRLIHNTQWGLVCPVMSPEGGNCGLVKDAAITMFVSMSRDPGLVLIKSSGYWVGVQTEDARNGFYVNGVPYGFCNSKKLHEHLLTCRRNQSLYFDTGIILDTEGELWVYTNEGRVCRPLLIVNPDTQTLYIDDLGLRNQPLTELMAKGAIEYIDSAEQEEIHIYIAETGRHLAEKRERMARMKVVYDDIVADPMSTSEEIAEATRAKEAIEKEKPYTHCEIDPSAILGLSAITMPFQEFNPGPRTTYQAAMVRQALGPNSSRIELRYDTTMRTIVEPGVPTITTDAHEWLGLDEFPQGQEAVIAITTYGGGNQEDALVFNKDAVDRGMFMMMIYHSYTMVVCQSKSISEIVEIPAHSASQASRYSKLDPATGIVRVGEYVDGGDALVGKTIIDKVTDQKKNGTLFVEVGQQGFVDSVYETENAESCRMIRIRIRELRKLQPGDKLASRYSQKGTIGEILPGRDFPWVVSDKPELNGLRPHIIFNPHGIPSRMTMGKLFEVLVGKLSGITANRMYATSFRRYNYEDTQKELERLGFSKSGKERMINGITGREMDVDIYIGPVYYQLLRHLVKDKMWARGSGAVLFQTRQPPTGIKKGGGLKFGEMERDCLIEYGSSYLAQERLKISSDAWQGILCKKCGHFAISNVEQGTFRCRSCTDPEFGRVNFPYILKLLMHYLSGLGISMRYGVAQ